MEQEKFKMPIDYSVLFSGLPQGQRTPSLRQNQSDQQSFQPQYHQIKKMGLKPNKKKLRTGGWSSRENSTYLHFMRQNIRDFMTEKARRTTKVFFRLSKILKKRTPDQCRSHHQKLQMKYKDDVYAIMGEVQRKINKTIAEEYVSSQIRMQFSNAMLKKELRVTGRTGADEQEGRPGNQHGWYNMVEEKGVIKISIVAAQIKSWQPF